MFSKQLAKFDEQLVLHFDLERKRWIVLRMPEKYGRPRNDYTHGEVKHATSEGALNEIFVCQDDSGAPIEPGDWIIDYLRKRDSRRINFRQYVKEMDARNQRLVTKAQDDASDRIRYRVGEEWNHLRDELRGELGFRKYTITRS